MQQKYFDAKTGKEKKPAYDGEAKKPAPKQATPAKAPAPKPAPAPAAAPNANEGLVQQIVAAIAELLTKPSGSSQPQMQQEDAERKAIQRRGAPLDPNAGQQRVDSYDGASKASKAKKPAPAPMPPSSQPPPGATSAAGMPPPPMANPVKPPMANPIPAPMANPVPMSPPFAPPSMQPPAPLGTGVQNPGLQAAFDGRRLVIRKV